MFDHYFSKIIRNFKPFSYFFLHSNLICKLIQTKNVIEENELNIKLLLLEINYYYL